MNSRCHVSRHGFTTKPDCGGGAASTEAPFHRQRTARLANQRGCISFGDVAQFTLGNQACIQRRPPQHFTDKLEELSFYCADAAMHDLFDCFKVTNFDPNVDGYVDPQKGYLESRIPQSGTCQSSMHQRPQSTTGKHNFSTATFETRLEGLEHLVETNW